MSEWLHGAEIHDLHPGIGNGPFEKFLGVILHVNVDENGTPDSYWGNNPESVCPNFQVYKDGSIHQMLPLNWQPWCQRDGNFHYAAIETAGLPDEPLTDAQLHSIARIVRAYHDHLGMPLKITNRPGRPGFGTHAMGGESWGGHACPGEIRAHQRHAILALADKLGSHPRRKPPAKKRLPRKPATKPPAPRPATPKPATYTVRKGDTLAAIAKAHGTTVRQLVTANVHHHASLGWNPNFIQTGWQLTIPGQA